MSDISLGNYEQNQLQTPNLNKLPAQAPAQTPIPQPNPSGLLPRGGLEAASNYLKANPQIGIENEQNLVGRTAFNSSPVNIQQNIENWVRLNPHLKNDPTALMTLARETGIPQQKLHAMVSWAVMDQPVNVLHQLATAGERFAQNTLGGIMGITNKVANFIPGFANQQSQTPTIEEWQKTVDGLIWKRLHKNATPDQITAEYNKQVNNPNKLAYRQEEQRSNFYTRNAAKDWHAVWHDTAGTAMDIATSTFHMPSYLISDTYHAMLDLIGR